MIALACSVSAPAAAQLQQPRPEVAADVAKTDRYPAHDVTFPNGVRGIPGVVYWELVGYRPLMLDLYLSRVPSSGPRPAFPWIGTSMAVAGWAATHTASGPFVDFPGVLASLSARGYIVASIEYRLSGDAKFPAQAQDVKAAIRWLRLNPLKYGIDQTIGNASSTNR